MQRDVTPQVRESGGRGKGNSKAVHEARDALNCRHARFTGSRYVCHDGIALTPAIIDADEVMETYENEWVASRLYQVPYRS